MLEILNTRWHFHITLWISRILNPINHRFSVKLRMRYVLVLLLSLHFSAQGQQIDSLRTNEQVLAFLKGKTGYGKDTSLSFTPSRNNETLNHLSNRAKAFKQPPFAKADFDNNGYTDLLFNGYLLPYDQQISLVVMNMGMGMDSFVVKDLTPIRSHYFAGKLLVIHNKPYIEALDVYEGYNSIQQADLIERYDTLECQYGEFIERTTPARYTLGQLSYACCIGWGAPELSLTICGDSALVIREAIFYPKSMAIDSGGAFVARLPEETKAQLTGLISHIPIPQLKEEYRAAGSCHTRNYLKFVYNNRQVKMTTNCGVGVPYSVEALEDLLWHLCSTLSWIKIESDTPIFECDRDPGSN